MNKYEEYHDHDDMSSLIENNKLEQEDYDKVNFQLININKEVELNNIK